MVGRTYHSENHRLQPSVGSGRRWQAVLAAACCIASLVAHDLSPFPREADLLHTATPSVIDWLWSDSCGHFKERCESICWKKAI
jgi:hypothetical protein